MNNFKNKSYANTFIYSKKDESGHDTELALIKFIKFSQRINKGSEAFKAIQNEVKVRQKTAVLYRILMMDDVVLCMNDKELPASFKVFLAKDIAVVNGGGVKPRVFIDVTGLFKLENGYYVCKEIDKLCAYLLGALVHLLYQYNTTRITSNANIVRTSAVCFTKLFTNVLDNLRIIGFNENRLKIAYIAAVYYLYNIMQKDLSSAQKTAASILTMNVKDAYAYDYYYQEEDLANIDIFITFLASTFKMKDLSTDIFISRWILLYGKGTMYGLELLPSFLCMMTNAYSGSYVNNQKTIELICNREMVDLSTNIIRVGAESYERGFKYEATMTKNDYAELKNI